MTAAILILAMTLISNAVTETDEEPTVESILSDLVSVTVTRSTRTGGEIRFWDIDFSKEEVESIRKYLMLAKPRSMNNPIVYSYDGSIKTHDNEWRLKWDLSNAWVIHIGLQLATNPVICAEFDIPSPHGIEFKRLFEKLCEHKMQRAPDRIEKISKNNP